MNWRAHYTRPYAMESSAPPLSGGGAGNASDCPTPIHGDNGHGSTSGAARDTLRRALCSAETATPPLRERIFVLPAGDYTRPLISSIYAIWSVSRFVSRLRRVMVR